MCKNPGCGEQVLLSKLEDHLKRCLKRQVECKDCSKKMSLIEVCSMMYKFKLGRVENDWSWGGGDIEEVNGVNAHACAAGAEVEFFLYVSAFSGT